MNQVNKVNIHPSWKSRLASEFEKDYFKKLSDEVREEYVSHTIYPPPKDVFRAFDLCPFKGLLPIPHYQTLLLIPISWYNRAINR